ncbi:hypothetical protein [uncultured Clostridium sp.]|uniref:hypothetical protein n=1 Tax=uncultured Clostridium sp. TaxID=59620 RepID=UPI003217F74D
MQEKTSIKYLPIFTVLAYSTFTILLFAISPWEWNINNPGKFYSYLIILNLALFLGYFISVKNHKYVNIDYSKYDINIIKILTVFLYILLTITLCGFFLDFDVRIGHLFQTLIEAVKNPAKYYYSYKPNSNIYFKLVIWTNVLFAPAFYCVIPLCTYYFKHLKYHAKITFIILVFFELSKWILKGTNKGIFDLFFIIFIVIFIKKIKQIREVSMKKFFKKNKIIIIASLFAIIIFLVYFTNNISSRISDNVGLSLGSIMAGMKVKENSILQSILPTGIFNMILIVSTYLCQGYYALSMAMNLPFTSTYGIGFSNFLMANAKEMLSIDLYSRTYLTKLEEFGWSSTVNWHTMYLWFANDVSFVGVIGVMFLIGYIFAKIWLSFIETNNPIALCILTLFGTMFLYMSANNQIFNFPTTCVAFFGLVFIWFITKIFERKKLEIPIFKFRGLKNEKNIK